MKQLKFSLFTGLILLTYLTACDKIEEPFVRTTGNGGNDTTTFVRKVLLEDYTGHKCVNCPGAAVIARDMQEQHEGQVIIMSVHAGFFAQPSSSGLYTTDFTTPEGDELDQFFGVSALGNPQGMVNRVGEGTARVLKPADWSAAFHEELEKPAEAVINIKNDFNESNGELHTTLEVTFIHLSQDLFRVCAYITEDSITAPQMNNDPAIGNVPCIEDYVHRHVLRGSLNNTWGDLITGQGVVADSVYTLEMSSFIIPSGWVAGHCSVVAFVYKQDNQEIIQAEEEHVK
ncbi:MAG: Omp28-related outer membrane protein [Bacteroidales bacterium]|nr:Omp28-related outer membrane protein [Bacteroidales bacterium]